MLTVRKVEVPTTPTSITTLTGGTLDRCTSLLLQAAKDNAADVLFGEKGFEDLFIVAGGTAGLDVTNARDVYIYGTAGDYVTIAAS